MLTAVLAALLAVTPPVPERDPDVVRKSFVILKATASYADAGRWRRRRPSGWRSGSTCATWRRDRTMGLTFPEDDCRNEFGEFPCYVARGRWDDGVYLSVEHSSSYEGFEEGQYLVVLASGSPRDRGVGAALRRAKGSFPETIVKTAPVYVGCIH